LGLPSSTYNINSININTPNNLVLSNSSFNAMAVNFNYNATLNNCNLTNYAALNSSKAVTCWITGIMTWPEESMIISWGTGPFVVFLKAGATLNMQSNTFGLHGTSMLVTNGTVNYSPSDWYLDAKAYWINLGFVSAVSSNSFIYPSTFFGGTAMGTVINNGVIQFGTNAAIYFDTFSYSGGWFYQCGGGTLRFLYGTTTPDITYFGGLFLDGVVSLVYTTTTAASSFTSVSLFEWATSYTTATNMVFQGNPTYKITLPAGASNPGLNLCYYSGIATLSSTFTATSFSFSTCLGSAVANPTIGGVCSLLNGTAASYAGMTAGCSGTNAGNANCGGNPCGTTCTTSNVFGSGESIHVFFGLMLACILAMLFQ